MTLDMVPLVETPAQALYWLATFVIMGLLWWRGDRPERAGVLMVLANFVVSGLVDQLFWYRLTWAVMLADGMLLAALFGLAMRYPRWWICGAAGFALLAFLAHFARLLDAAILPWAYLTMIWLTGAGILLSLLAGVAEAPMARRYAAWLQTGGV